MPFNNPMDNLELKIKGNLQRENGIIANIIIPWFICTHNMLIFPINYSLYLE